MVSHWRERRALRRQTEPSTMFRQAFLETPFGTACESQRPRVVGRIASSAVATTQAGATTWRTCCVSCASVKGAWNVTGSGPALRLRLRSSEAPAGCEHVVHSPTRRRRDLTPR